MYLKSIEIHGFKSFANKIVFEFPEGITGIVGPNGSGKSNVADAVRWVLGEQKIKQLRGSKMEDVIFAGTSTRRPQSYAFVAITLNNADHKLKIDFDEVTISRRVYRSGESEYMINGSVCRLRDVQELFYDTGIGKEGYSIIGQGQIDRILQGKPEERREIFDEAAGIVKYKKRKTLSLRKLEQERQNMTRVNDILTELKRQVGPLKRQSEAAEQFVVYKNELKTYDINLFLFENGDIKARIHDTAEKEEIARTQLEGARKLLENTREEYEKLSEGLEGLDQEINALRSEIARSNIVRENLKGQIGILKEQIRSAEEAGSTFQDRLRAMDQELKDTLDEKERLIREKEENQEKLSRSIAGTGQKDSYVLDLQTQCDELSAQIEQAKEKLIALVNDRGQLGARRERLEAVMDEIRRRKEDLLASLAQYSTDKADKEKEVTALETEQKEVEELVRSAQEAVSENGIKLRSAQEKIRTQETELHSLKERQMGYQAALSSLRNITERYEGYGGTIREVMKLKEQNPGIHGVVADIIRTDKEYETAIETALGGSIQNVVTDTESTAKSVIEYLKKNRLGRATFLPLKAISGRGEFRNDEALAEPGVIGLASSLVHVDKQYEGVAEFLLGRIVVADSIDNALKLARKYRYSLIIVTLEGELLNRGGSLTGGTYKNKSNLLGRRREMEELQEKIDECQKQVVSVQKTIADAQERVKKLTAEIEDQKAQLQEHRIYLNTVNLNLNAARERTAQIEDQFRNADEESKSLAEQSGTVTDENTTIDALLDENQNDNEQLKEDILKLEQQLQEKKDILAREMLLAQTLKVDNTRMTEQNHHLSESIERSESSIRRLMEDMEQLKISHESSNKLIKEKQEEIVHVNESLALADTQIASLEEKLSGMEQEKETKSSTHREFIQKREEYSERVTNLDKEVFRLMSLREKLEERFDNKSNYIWEEYQLTYNNALELRDESMQDARQMREKIQELKTRIRGLGTINVGAIEEYREVKDRYEFLSNQYEDLVKAEADLVRIIRDLDKEMRRQFQTEFKKIRSEFARVFKEMFGGGYGTIELEEDVDVLEAGIRIIAQPPGKKLQNMMQLSGGEKALTAIAILFSIQNLKPSPFCILDEIEAALDDSNIIRYAGYLRKLTKDVQFIVITHRKGTMEAADRLYGITMQERGVSTLISVDLTDYEEEQAV